MIKKIAITLFVLGLFVVLFLNSGVTAYKAMQPSSTPTPLLQPRLNAYKLYELVNEYRESKGLEKLIFDPSMCSFTKLRLKQVHTDWSHNGFIPEAATYYNYIDAGENLAKGHSSEQDTLNHWITSKPHYDTMTNPAYDRTCIETDLHNGITYVVQEFANLL